MPALGLSLGLSFARRSPGLPSPALAWLSSAGVTGSPASAWLASPGGVSLSQGTAANRPAVTAAVFGSNPGLTFDGSNDLLSYSGKAVSNTAAGSLAIVFKTGASVTGPQVLLAQADSAVANDWWEIGIGADGRLYIESNAAGTKHTVAGSTYLSPSTNYDLLLTYDGTDFYLALNGTEENPLTITNAGAFAWLGRVGGTTVFSLGATVPSGGAARFFSGSLGVVEFWSTDITA